ncbi:hypothetical protein C427_2070 [Paraglaciecola psychrophila 170]|uniref:Uncharacterized protein n=1 Tax=Paraglaciecola psychrophila 170 TaxID=1129794 RepID=K7AZD2_9ALTE|nr:hypothetical protein C427_2070 [Paraglaciecola psychrophila 170]GAC40425.1 hypothetical protein GPSY_4823 [Paraglaciecola psychrophila 170]
MWHPKIVNKQSKVMTPPPRHKNQRINETSCFFIELITISLNKAVLAK